MIADITETAKISVLFFQEQPFYNFSRVSIYLSNRHVFSRRVYNYVLRTDTNFPGRFIEQHVFFKEGLYLFVKRKLLSHRTDINFAKNPYCFSPRTFTHFLGDPRNYTIPQNR